jgi:adenosylhomocysteine nucleosidase
MAGDWPPMNAEAHRSGEGRAADGAVDARPIGIVGAMPEEVRAVLAALSTSAAPVRSGGREYFQGKLWGEPAVVALSRIGKVAAAATMAELILRFNVRVVLFSGVAGAIDPSLRVGDIVVARRLVQHDMDASPIFPALEVPLLGRSHFDACEVHSARIEQAARQFVSGDLFSVIGEAELSAFGITRERPPRVVVGDIASGDRFVSSHDERERLRERLPGLLCVEMEGAAAAQVCHEYGVPIAVVRVISDAADDAAAVDFTRFIAKVAGEVSAGILRHALRT